MLNSKSLSKKIFLLVCLSVITLIVILMIKEQKKMAIISNQNVEVSEIIYKMKSLLSGNGCKENLAGLEKSKIKENLKFLKTSIIFPNGDEEIMRRFYTNNESGIISHSGLTIREYGHSMLNNQDYLDVVFNRHYDGATFIKKIPLYFTFFDNGRIKSCSLWPIKSTKELWESQSGILHLSKNFNLKINNSKSVHKLNLSGLLYVSGVLNRCDNDSIGTIAWNKLTKKFMICHKNELISLTDNLEVD